MFLHDNIKIEHLVNIDLERIDLEDKKEISTVINPDFQPDGEYGLSI